MFIDDGKVVVKKLAGVDNAVLSLAESLNSYLESFYPAESNHIEPLNAFLSENSCLFGAYIDSDLVGIGAGRCFGSCGELKRFFVKKECRGQGVADGLIAAIEKWFVDKEIFTVNLETGVEQLAAINFYRKCGYFESKPFGNYKEDPLSVFMSKRIDFKFCSQANSDTYHSVVFQSELRQGIEEEYKEVSDSISKTVSNQPGLIGYQSFRSDDGAGATVSYWKDEKAISDWKNEPEHRLAQERGRSFFYRSFRVHSSQVIT